MTPFENLEHSPLGQKQIEDEIKKVDKLYKASAKIKSQESEKDTEDLILPQQIAHIERAHFTPW